MSNDNDSTFEENQRRMNELDQCIEELFGHLAPDEVDMLAQNYIKSTTRMITVLKIRPRSSFAMDLMEDIELKPVTFPDKLKPLLRRNDVFLTTMGHRDGRWHVLYLSPLYRTQ